MTQVTNMYDRVYETAVCLDSSLEGCYHLFWELNKLSDYLESTVGLLAYPVSDSFLWTLSVSFARAHNFDYRTQEAIQGCQIIEEMGL